MQMVLLFLFNGLFAFRTRLYFSSYSKPREIVWLIGVCILILMIITAFLGMFYLEVK